MLGAKSAMGTGGLGFWRGRGGLTCGFWAVFAKDSLGVGYVADTKWFLQNRKHT
jgi:hypothetical protein